MNLRTENQVNEKLPRHYEYDGATGFGRITKKTKLMKGNYVRANY